MEQQFRSYDVVVHLRVVSQRGSRQERTDANVEVLRVFKGEFSGPTIWTLPGGICGLGEFKIGNEYVFFLPKSTAQISINNSGFAPTAEVLEKLNGLQ